MCMICLIKEVGNYLITVLNLLIKVLLSSSFHLVMQVTKLVTNEADVDLQLKCNITKKNNLPHGILKYTIHQNKNK